MVSRAKKPEKGAEEAAIELRQRSLLDKEIQDQEERLKALARGKLGNKSLLSGSVLDKSAGRRASSSGGSGRGSLIGGGTPSTTTTATSAK